MEALEYMQNLDHLATRVKTMKRRDDFIQIQKNYIKILENQNQFLTNMRRKEIEEREKANKPIS